MTAVAMTKGASQSNEQVIAVLTRAFAADPAVRWAYPDPRQYTIHFPAFVRAFAGKAFEHGTDHGIEGLVAALWLPPEVHPDEDALASVVQASVAEPQQEAMFAFMEEMGRYHPSEPHWHLPLIEVDPAHEGRGLGSTLLRHALRMCDRERKPAYLEATSDASRRLYETRDLPPSARSRSACLLPFTRWCENPARRPCGSCRAQGSAVGRSIGDSAALLKDMS